MSEMQRRNAYKQRAEEGIASSREFTPSLSTSLSTSPVLQSTSRFYNFSALNFPMDQNVNLPYMQTGNCQPNNFSNPTLPHHYFDPPKVESPYYNY